MRLTLVTSSLGAGGAERVLSIMANYWAKSRAVTVITLDGPETQPAYELDSQVKRVGLGLAGPLRGVAKRMMKTLARIRILRRAIAESCPDVVVSFIDRMNILTLLALRGRAIPVVVSERTDPTMSRIGFVSGFLRAWTYPAAARVVVQTERARRHFASIGDRVCVIPNPVLSPRGAGRSERDGRQHRSIVAVGRLSPEKGFDMLLRAFAKLKDRHPAWSLTIVGDGPCRSALTALGRELGLEERVRLVGTTTSPGELLQRSDLFVLSSRFEGFPNALCEAMAYGLPVIAADCPSGPREIVRHEVDGLLIPPEDVDALAAAMDRLIRNEPERHRMGQEGRSIVARYPLEKIMSLWDDVLLQAVAEARY